MTTTTTKKTGKWRRRALIGAGVVAVGVPGLWVAIHEVPGVGPALADGARWAFGPKAVAWAEDVSYDIQDRFDRWRYKDAKPKTFWDAPVAYRPRQPGRPRRPQLPVAGGRRARLGLPPRPGLRALRRPSRMPSLPPPSLPPSRPSPARATGPGSASRTTPRRVRPRRWSRPSSTPTPSATSPPSPSSPSTSSASTCTWSPGRRSPPATRSRPSTGPASSPRTPSPTWSPPSTAASRRPTGTTG